MVKTRPVVVLSGKGVGTCTVIPLSTTAPQPSEAWHHLMSEDSLPESLQAEAHWAKCDMISTVSFARLDRVRNGRDAAGKRLYVAHQVSRNDLTAMELCVLKSLCMMHLLKA